MASRKEGASKVKPEGGGGFADTIPPDLRKPLENLKKHENTILKTLNRDPRMAGLFLTDPGTALARMKIPVDPVIRKRAVIAGQAGILAPRRFCLPGGKTITPRIRVNFVAHRKEG
ncbi:MAG TPA: hypothetical protein VMS81_01525 [Methanomicrobiales archaeon]|jgi:hypothetical protein|nr:hypothetical protein [Methanomicrobiales archaeon]